MNKKIKVGDFVKWQHIPPSWFGNRIINCEGKVEELRYSTGIGGKYKKEMIAKIKVIPNNYWIALKRKSTTIKLYIGENCHRRGV